MPSASSAPKAWRNLRCATRNCFAASSPASTRFYPARKPAAAPATSAAWPTKSNAPGKWDSCPIVDSRKNFIPRNDGFTCEFCHAKISPAPGTFRNHCPACLNSKHVDGAVPGDRAATCDGCMTVIAVEGTDPDNLDLIHECQTCSKISRNRTAPDDNQDLILKKYGV